MAGTAAFGTKLSYDTGPVLVGGLTNVEGINQSAGKMDVTTHDSTGGYKEYIPTLLEPGEFSIEGYMKPNDAGQVALDTHFRARDVRAMTITYPDGPGNTDGSTFEFDAEITNLKMGDAPVDGVLGFSATIQISGVPVFTPVGAS
jgi:predicted secreted protein